MTWLRNGLVLLLVAYWLPVSMHCRLVQLPALAFLACCDHPSAAPHEDEGCELDGCDVIESGLYQAESRGRFLPEPNVLSVDGNLDVEPSSFLPVAALAPTRGLAPPELGTRWQFIFRDASPPRAPSLSS